MKLFKNFKTKKQLQRDKIFEEKLRYMLSGIDIQKIQAEEISAQKICAVDLGKSNSADSLKV